MNNAIITKCPTESHLDCPACNQTGTVPVASLIRQPTIPGKVLVQGTCDNCESTRTQWVEDDNGKIIRRGAV